MRLNWFISGGYVVIYYLLLFTKVLYILIKLSNQMECHFVKITFTYKIAALSQQNELSLNMTKYCPFYF